MASASGRDGRAQRAFVVIGLVAILLAALLSGAWYYLARQLDARAASAIEEAAARGVSVDCPQREVFGYPFRLGLRCAAFGLDVPGETLRLTGGALRTAAQIYRPNRVVGELDGPVVVTRADAPPVTLTWSLAQASSTFWTQGVDHFALVLDGLSVGAGEPGAGVSPLAESARVEAHGRRREADLDLALSALQLRALVPAAAGLPAADTALDVTIAGAADWLGGAAAGRSIPELMAGRSGTLRAMRIDLGASDADLSGPFEVSPEGEISGRLQLAVTDPAAVAGTVAAAVPALAGVANAVASAISFAGREVDGRRVVDLTLDEGRLSAGFLPLGRIPPLR
ncbi:DUF2125 domain-containing protein [Aurantimonas sp. Leaf443]|uniref:DUF2125 domain-containing protein n=1 Tax=Aurantimonas sp. Leaf443 TaxID=1736378 RepID=UPI0006FA98B1|nr:DUF2125 domain-containing protein [Aurantimonas sp. Leaf443]KQT85847.1 hypothetical protein ASG48_04340 [Aurantimonas sp. Leaf443]